MKSFRIMSILILMGASLMHASFFGSFSFGSLQSWVAQAASALRAKTIRNSYYETGLSSGTTVGNVNLFTGVPTYSIPLGSISALGKVSFPFALSYSGNVRQMQTGDNEIAPTSFVGLGWDLGVNLSVSVNHKGTFFNQDDVYYVSLGPNGGGQLIQNGSGKFFIADNPYVDISVDRASTGVLKDQIESWTFTIPGSGIKYVFGQKDSVVSNTERIQYHTKGLVRISSFAKDSAQPFIYKWDLRKIVDAENKNEIDFVYQKFDDTLFGTKPYTRESYVQSIKWLDRKGGEAMRWDFTLGNKTSGEFVRGDSLIPRYDMAPYDSKYLSKIEQFCSGIKNKELDFSYTVKGSGYYKKRVLDSVTDSERLSKLSSTLVSNFPWKMTYAPDTMFDVLTKVTSPNGASTEFQFMRAPFGTEASQEPTDSLRDTNGVAIPFTNHSSDTVYDNLSTCDERFCYLVADSNSINGKIHINVIQNRGNFFDRGDAFRVSFKGATAKKTSWRFLQTGDFFFVYDANDTILHSFLWNGFDWKKQDDLVFKTFADTTLGIDVYPTLDYMIVVQKTATKSRTKVFLRVGDIGWSDVNSSTCSVNNDTTYGDSVKTTGDSCMVWNGPVQVNVSGNLFTVVHNSTNIIYAYQLNQDGLGFTNVSRSFKRYSTEIQDATNHNRWNKEIREITMGQDYILIRSDKGSGQNQERIDVFHFDGFTFHGVDSTGWETANSKALRAYPGDDYFLTVNQDASKHEVRYWKKRISGDSLYFSKTQVRNDVPDTNVSQVVIQTNSIAFALQFARLDTAFGGGLHFPLVDSSVMDYRSFLYQIDPDTAPGFRDRSSEIRYLQSPTYAKLIGLSFSGSDNMLTGIDMRKSTNSNDLVDNHATSANIAGLLTAKMRRKATGSTPFLYSINPYQGIGGSTFPKHLVISNAARLGLNSDITTTSSLFLFNLSAYDGNDYLDKPDSINVVSKMIQRSGLNQGNMDVYTSFVYDTASTSKTKFNIFSQTPMFNVTSVKQTDSAGNALNQTQYTHNLDMKSNPLRRKILKQNGTLTKTQSYDKASHLIGTQSQFYRADSKIALDASWPSTVSLTQMDSTISVDIRPNQSRMTHKVSYHSYSLKTGAPRFTKHRIDDTTWLVSQTVYNDSGLMKESYSYNLTTQPTDALLDTLKDVRLDSLHAISATKVEYSASFPFLQDKDSLWRTVDGSFTDDSLRKGVEPIFNLNNGWLPGNIVTARDSLNLVEEAKLIKDTATGVFYSSTFYEGKYSQPVGSVSNSKLKNCAVLMAENGSLSGLASHDFDGRWETGDSGFSTTQAHTGDYSIKVVDNYGPTINLYLEDVRQNGFDYVVSAWIYAESGVTPQMTVERRRSDNSGVDSYAGSVVGGVIKRRQWQRWEVKLTNAQLISGNLFNGSADYLRVWVGTGAPSSQPTKIVYVDDIVCRPGNSTFGLTTYDYRGLTSSTTDTQHLTSYGEQDFLGRPMISREERFRNYSQSAEHRLGENQ